MRRNPRAGDTLAEAGAALLAGGATAGGLVALEAGVTRATGAGGSLAVHAWLSLWAVSAAIVFLGLLVLALVAVGARAMIGNHAPRLIAFHTLSGAAIAGTPAWFVGRTLAAGEWINTQSYAQWIPIGVACIASAAAGLAAWIDGRLTVRDTSGGRRTAWLVAVGVGAGCLTVADLLILPNLYAPVHLFAEGTAGLLAAVASARLARSALGIRAVPALGWTLGGGLVLGAGALLLTAPNPATRAQLLLGSPRAANWYRFVEGVFSADTSHVRHAIEGLDTRAFEAPAEPAPGRSRAAFGIDDRWNVVLITVDTLRADALLPVRREGRQHAAPGDTPELDALVQRSFRFRHAYAQASITHRSLPPTFRSIETHEDPETIGVDLASAMQALGRVPVAVVNSLFLEPSRRDVRQLTRGFHTMNTYKPSEMQRQVELVREVVSPLVERPFFAWVHFFCMHRPGFDGKLLSRSGASWKEKYRRSLRWLDAQIGALLGLLEQLRIGDRTLLVLASDHGEGLGDHRVGTHGGTVFEEEIRTPLLISIPGVQGHEISATVGNIDIVPTLYELLGAEPEPSHRGRSLVPLLENPAAQWSHAYYSESDRGTMISLVQDRQKLIFDALARVFLRFDLERDPTEQESVFGRDPRADLPLMLSLIERNPGPLHEELRQMDTRVAFEAAWTRARTARANSSLELLLKLTALEPSVSSLAKAAQLFREGRDDDVRLLVLRYLFRRDPERLAARLEERLRSIAGTEQELGLVEALAAQGQPAFAPQYVFERLARVARDGTEKDWKPWLRLILRWEKPDSRVLGDMLVPLLAPQRDRELNPRSLELLLLNLASFSLEERARGDQAFVDRLLGLSRHQELAVAAAACRALARTHDRRSLARLESIVADPDADIRLRQTALRSYLEARELAGMGLAEAHRGNPLLLVETIRFLGERGDPDGLPFLRRISEEQGSRVLGEQARGAIWSIDVAEQFRARQRSE